MFLRFDHDFEKYGATIQPNVAVLVSHAASLPISSLNIIVSPTVSSYAENSISPSSSDSQYLQQQEHPPPKWDSIQSFLRNLYIKASNASYNIAHNPMLDVNVIFEGWCGYDPWMEAYDNDLVIMGYHEGY